MINTNGCGAKPSPFGGAVVPVRGRARWRHPGPGGPPCGWVAKGAVPGSGVGGGGRGTGFAVRPPSPLCRAEYASVIAGQTPEVTDQDLRWSEAWLRNRRHLAGVIRTVVARLPPQAHHRGHGLWEHLARPQHGAGGAFYANRLEGWMNLAPRIGWGVGCGECVGPEIAQELLY
jgi:hypothetical protein